MSVLNNIRKRGIFLIIVIAMALFAFILADLIGQGSFSNETQNNIATINGQDISYFEFNNRVNAVQQNSPQNLTTIQAVNQLWDATIQQTLIEEQMDKLGIDIGNRQLITALEMQFGGNPEYLTDGQFDVNKFRASLEQIRAIDPASYQQWIATEKNIADQAKAEVYFDLLGAGLGVTTAEAKQIYQLNNTSFNLQYVRIPYSSVSENEVTVSDSEIKKYINNHKTEFTSDGSLDIRYVLFEEKPTAQDEEEIKNSLAALLEDHTTYNKAAGIDETVKGFKNITNYQEYLSEYSDLPFNNHYLFKKDLPSLHADTLANLPVGDVFGSYKEDGYFKYTKMVDRKEMPDSVDVKHILIRYSGLQSAMDIDRTRAEAEQLADSLLSEIESNKDSFEELAIEYSDDQNTAPEGGEIGWIPYPKKEEDELISFVFNSEAGSVDILETEFGFHITYIAETRNKQPAFKLATLARAIEPSDETIGDLFNKTTNFQIAANEGDFAQEAQSEGYQVRTVKNLGPLDENITGIGSHRNIVQWAFEDKAKAGDINRFDIDQGYVVVQVTAKTSKGLASVEEARNKVKPILLKEKKAKHIISNISTDESLADIAASYGTQPRTNQEVTFENPNLEGEEPKVLAHAFSLEKGEVSDPIVGNSGVYLIKLINKKEAADIGSYNGIINREHEKTLEKASNEIFEALKSDAKIEDNRSKFY
ncbi:MAG TPA: peptidylprolyl isomerase [Flavobacteriaceae bacterium]|nr:peptidylprolyl isomerase [Flavobacteriaceae bacterium]